MPRLPRSRTATPEELAKDRRRCLAAKPQAFAPIDEARAARVMLTKCVRKGCERDAGPGGFYCPPHTAERTVKPSIAALRAGLRETRESPAMTMAELVASNDNGECLS